MENPVGSAIEKIKLQEQDKEAKLKEKRELEATITSLNRSIRDVVSQIEKYQEEINDLTKGNDRLRAELEVERIRRDAVAAQLEACNKEIETLKVQSDKGISEVWEVRSSLCSAVQSVSDECDVWALLAKPINTEPIHRIVMNLSENNEAEMVSEETLKKAKERRDKAIAERERLLAEPENGEEFVRSCIQKQRNGRCFSTKVEPNENEPIKFSTSPAAQKKTIRPIVVRTKPSDMPWYQPYSVLASVTVFLIYFCVLREESDVDLEFNKTLYERIKGLEKEQLLQSYRYNKENGLSVEDIEKRLKELEIKESNALA